MMIIFNKIKNNNKISSNNYFKILTHQLKNNNNFQTKMTIKMMSISHLKIKTLKNNSMMIINIQLLKNRPKTLNKI